MDRRDGLTVLIVDALLKETLTYAQHDVDDTRRTCKSYGGDMYLPYWY